MRVLVSGFGPFLDEKVNPSESIVNFLNSCDSHARASAGWSSLDVRGVLLPVAFDEAFRRLEQERLMFKPDVILSFGLAGGRQHIEIEQIAMNLRPVASPRTDSDLSDYIDDDAPLALPTTPPSEKMLASLILANVPSRLSYSAGSYVCNDLFFQMQNRLRFTRVRSGFIHVPRMITSVPSNSVKRETEPASWRWELIERAVNEILATFARE